MKLPCGERLTPVLISGAHFRGRVDWGLPLREGLYGPRFRSEREDPQTGTSQANRYRKPTGDRQPRRAKPGSDPRT